MARPKTKGDPISIRLSQHHDRLLRMTAEQVGKPVTTLATEMLERLLDPPTIKYVKTAAAAAHDPTCRCTMCQPNSGVYEKAKKGAKR